MRRIWFSIDNMFRVDVPDDATEEQITQAMYDRLHDVLSHCEYGDFTLITEEEEKEE